MVNMASNPVHQALGLHAGGAMVKHRKLVEVATPDPHRALAVVAAWLKRIGRPEVSAHDALGIVWSLGATEFVSDDGQSALKASLRAGVYHFEMFQAC